MAKFSANPLVQASFDLSASLTAEDRYRRLLRAVRQVIPADTVVITRLRDDGLHPVAFDGLRPSFGECVIPRDDGPHSQLLSARGPLRIERGHPSLFPTGPFVSERTEALGVWMGAPLRVEGETVGTLAMTAADPRAFDEVDDDTVMGFAALAAAALRTAFLLDSLARERDTLQERVAFEALVLSISARFIHLPADELEQAIYDALRQVGEYAGVDRSYIAVAEEDMRAPDFDADRYMHLLYEWSREGIESSAQAMARAVRSERERKKNSAARRFMVDQIISPGVIRVDCVDQLPRDADAVRWRWRIQGCKSVLVVPLGTDGRVFGIVGFDAVREPKLWTDETVKLLQTVGYILASAIERKRDAEALARAHDDLEHLVERRTRELKEKQGQLVQSEKMAALGQLVAGIAHEVNTPLGAIKSNNDTLRRSLSRLRTHIDPQHEHAGRAFKLLEIAQNLGEVSEEAIQRITKIVGSLRNFARLDQSEVERIDLHDGIESTLTLVHHKTKSRIEIVRDYARLPPIECHGNQLNQVFMNLLVNSIQAISGRGRIVITTRALDERVEVAFDDDGAGIAPEHMARIFDPGFTTKGVGVGTGLGLAIVHQIVEEHAGRVEVQSEPGRGTTVRVQLPVEHPRDHHN